MLTRCFNRLIPLKPFLTLWSGQVVSWTGTQMTRFALTIWAFEKTGTATSLALLGVAGYLSYVIASPLAGPLVDRWPRRRSMFLADLGSAGVTALLLALFSLGRLEIWHLYLAEFLTGVFDAFQEPAWGASVSQLVPQAQYGRAQGLQSLGSSAARVFAPAAAGLLLAGPGLSAVLLIDLISFGAAVATLALVRIPPPVISEEGLKARGDALAQIRFGFSYLRRAKGLRIILPIMTMINFLAAITYFGILPAMILNRSGHDRMALAAVQGALGIGGVVGAALFAAWGGPRRLVYGFLAATAISFLSADFLLGIGQSLPVWVLAAFIATLTIPFLTGPYYAIWMKKVPSDIQGRVFAARNMLQTLVMPVGFLAGGLLADRVFGPAMMPGGALVPLFGGIVGSGPGAGMGLMFLGTCLLGTFTGLSGFLFREVREL